MSHFQYRSEKMEEKKIMQLLTFLVFCSSYIVNVYSIKLYACICMFRGYPVGQVCKSCASGCTSCEKNATHCLSCEETLLLHNHECVAKCPSGHTVRNGECVQCPESCVICSEDGLCTGETEIHHSFARFHELFFYIEKIINK